MINLIANILLNMRFGMPISNNNEKLSTLLFIEFPESTVMLSRLIDKVAKYTPRTISEGTYIHYFYVGLNYIYSNSKFWEPPTFEKVKYVLIIFVYFENE